MTTYTATYSPDDNKLRLTASARLDADTYARVKAAGFAWAPKQEQFIAPMWTPARADLCIELAGQIDDDDGSLIERAEDRAERFEDYSDKRGTEAARALDYVHKIADGIPLGQPILIGHHSERHARKDAERIENGMRKAVQLFDTSEYWQRRAAAAIAHAKYKERPDVRHRRIKGIEADARKVRKNIEAAEQNARIWAKVPRYEWDQQTAAALYIAGRASGSFGVSLYTDLAAGRMHGDTAWRRAVAMAEAYANGSARRWLEHYENRLTYERAMLAEAGGIVAERFDLQPGGTITHRGRRSVILRVNRRDGATLSVSVTGQGWTVGVEEITSYEPPSEAAADAAAALVKAAPLCNYPGRNFVHVTAAQWDDIAKDYKGTRDMGAGVDGTRGGHSHDSLRDYREGSEVYMRHRVRVAMGAQLRRVVGLEAWAQMMAASSAELARESNTAHGMHPVYISDAKTKEPVRIDAPPKAPRKTMARKVAEAAGVDTSSQPDPDPEPPTTPPGAAAPAPDRLFIGVFPTGISYADRAREKDGDWARVAFLGYADLVLTIEPDCPDCLRLEITEHAATLQRRRGEAFEVSTAGQTVTLGHALRDDPPPATSPVCELTAAKRAAWAIVADLTAPAPRVIPLATHTAPPAGDSRAADFEALRQSLRAGVQVVSAPQLFPTPPDLAARMVEAADIRPGDRVLEPSAGTGRIVDAIVAAVPLDRITLDCIEVRRDLADRLRKRHPGAIVRPFDFLQFDPNAAHLADAVLMNPPFANGVDVDHVTHAVRFLKPGGRLVAIMSAGVTFRNDRKTRDLRRLVASMGGDFEELPPDTFASSGTGVRTVLVVLDAPERAQANPPADHLEAAPAVRAESDPPAVAVPDPVP